MDARKRVKAALHGAAPDRVPRGEILIEPGFLKEAQADSLAEFLPRLGADLVTLEVGLSTPPCEIGHWSRLGLFVFLAVCGPLQVLLKSRGLKYVSRLLVKEPGRAAEEIGAVARACLTAAERGLAAGADGVVILDDVAGNQGPLLSPVVLDRVYFPELAELTAALERQGVPVLFHSDGNILSLLGPLQKAGFRGVQGLQPAAGMDPESVRHRCPPDWVFWGNFEFEAERGMKTPMTAACDARELQRRWAGSPGFIFGSCGGLYPGITAAAVEAAYAALD